MSLLAHAPTDPTCDHKLAYAIADQKVHCYGCNAEWPQAEEVAEAPQPAKKRRGRTPAVGTASAEVPSAPPAEVVRDTDVQDSGDGDPERGEQTVPVPETSAVEGSVPKASRRRKKADAAPEVVDAPEYQEVGPWHDSLKCPERSCFSKLQHHAPNIINNGQTTYHYGCPTCDDVRVTVHIGELK